MGKYPYIKNTGRLRNFLQQIPKIKTPEKVTQRYLVTVGFKGNNDRPIVKILQNIGFTESNKATTDRYRDFKLSSKSKIAMASGIKSGYADFFKIYDDPKKVDSEKMKDFFKQSTDAGDQVVNSTIATFEVLCEFADFEAVESEDDIGNNGETNGQDNSDILSGMGTSSVGTTSMGKQVTVNVNIQFNLPPNQDAEVYDKIFKALKNNLLT